VWPGRALELSLLGRKAVTNKTNGVSKSKNIELVRSEN
jgi:hypothetical protein